MSVPPGRLLSALVVMVPVMVVMIPAIVRAPVIRRGIIGAATVVTVWTAVIVVIGIAPCLRSSDRADGADDPGESSCSRRAAIAMSAVMTMPARCAEVRRGANLRPRRGRDFSRSCCRTVRSLGGRHRESQRCRCRKRHCPCHYEWQSRARHHVATLLVQNHETSVCGPTVMHSMTDNNDANGLEFPAPSLMPVPASPAGCLSHLSFISPCAHSRLYIARLARRACAAVSTLLGVPQ